MRKDNLAGRPAELKTENRRPKVLAVIDCFDRRHSAAERAMGNGPPPGRPPVKRIPRIPHLVSP